MIPGYWHEAASALGQRDPVLRQLIAVHGGVTLRRRGDAFTTLARSIVGQQISVKAAASVWERLLAACGRFTPALIAAMEQEALRRCGLSGRKAAYIHDLARGFLDGTLQVDAWQSLEDEALIRELTQIKGVGRWTAEMFLIFHMLRPDVLPLDDIGLQRAMSRHYNRERPLSRLRMGSIARKWMPWRSVATWYLWRSLDPLPVEY